MSVTYEPEAIDALFDTYAGVIFNDPGSTAYAEEDPERIDSKYFLKPIQDEVLNLIRLMAYSGAGIRVRNQTGGDLTAGTLVYMTGVRAIEEEGDSGNQLSSWVLTGWTTANTLNGRLYWSLTNSGSNRTIRLYRHKSMNSAYEVASGTRSGDGSITISQVNSSGISGSVTVAYTADDSDTANILYMEMPQVAKADASDTTKRAMYVVESTISSATNGLVYGFRLITGLNTNMVTAAGDKIYALSTVGTFGVIPTDANHEAQEVGTVLIKSATVGVAIFYPGMQRVVKAAQIAGMNGAVLSPSQITSNQNNYNPTNLATAIVMRLSTDASRDITGLAGGADARKIRLHNIGSFNIVLKHESGSSTAANRFVLVDATDLTVKPNQVVLLDYDATTARWRVISGGSASSGHSLDTLFGDASDGNVTISANTTITRDMYYDTLTVDSTFTLDADGFIVFAKTAAVINGNIANNGANGSGTTGGAAAGSGTIGGGSAGGAGDTGANGVAGSALSDGVGAAGGQGGNGGTGSGAAGGSVTAPTAAKGGTQIIKSLIRAVTGRLNDATIFNGGSGGGGGGRGSTTGGAGGGGGGVCLVIAKAVSGSGKIQANGGNGADGAANDGGGGGGGGGGVVILVCDSVTGVTLEAAGGNGGGSGAGGGGLDGDPGSNGTTIQHVI